MTKARLDDATRSYARPLLGGPDSAVARAAKGGEGGSQALPKSGVLATDPGRTVRWMSSVSAALVSRDRGKPSPALAATLKASGTLALNIDPEKIQGIRSALMDSTVAGSLTAEQLRRVETGWPQSTLPGTVRAATLRAAEKGLVAGGTGGLSVEVYRLAADAIPTGGFSSILDSVAYKRFREGISSGLVPRVVDAAQELMSSATISGRLRAEAPKMAGVGSLVYRRAG